MSERNEKFVNRCRAAILMFADSAELERYLRAAVAEEFPVVKPASSEETIYGKNYVSV